MLSGLIHVVTWVCTSLLRGQRYSTVWMRHGRLSIRQVMDMGVVSTAGLFMGRAAVNIGVQVLHERLFSVPLGGPRNGDRWVVWQLFSFSRDCQTASLRALFWKDPHCSRRALVLANDEGHGQGSGKPAHLHGEPVVLTHKASGPSLPSQTQTPSLRRVVGASRLPCATPFLTVPPLLTVSFAF